MTFAVLQAALASRPLARFSERCPALLRDLAERVNGYALGRYAVWVVGAVALAAKYTVSYGVGLAAIGLAVEWVLFPARRLGAACATASSSPTGAVAGAPSGSILSASSAASAAPVSGPVPSATPPEAIPASASAPSAASDEPFPPRKQFVDLDAERYLVAIERQDLSGVQAFVNSEKGQKFAYNQMDSEGRWKSVSGTAFRLAAFGRDQEILELVTAHVHRDFSAAESGQPDQLFQELIELFKFLIPNQEKAKMIAFRAFKGREEWLVEFMHRGDFKVVSKHPHLLTWFFQINSPKLKGRISIALEHLLREATQLEDEATVVLLLNSGKLAADHFEMALAFHEALRNILSQRGQDRDSVEAREKLIRETPLFQRIRDYLDSSARLQSE